MSKSVPTIDEFLFDRHAQAFVDFVESKNNESFSSFEKNTYIEGQEGYNERVYREGQAHLGFNKWNESQIGSGDIAYSVISALKARDNNFIQWQEKSKICEDFQAPDRFQLLERVLFDLYRSNNDQQAFKNLVTTVGKKYSLIAYLFFLRDSSKYLPIKTTYFEKALGYLGADLQLSGRCSWESYQSFLRLVNEVGVLLRKFLECEVTLLNAHSFVWILSKQMEEEAKLPDTSIYRSMLPTQKKALRQARIGQEPWRNKLLELWGGCAVTGLSKETLLTASHIKPWAECNDQERLDVANGFPLSPALDACFDKGLISFTDDGKILISPSLSNGDLSTLGIHSELRLRRVDEESKKYLEYHRNLFQAKALSLADSSFV